MKPIISVEGLGKSYTIRHEGQTHYKSLREELFKLPKRLLSNGGQSQEEFWALRDVNFDIMPGDRVGIIGRNGAGKSTLLKLLSRITEPTTGRITLRGRVASLLEVGTGFHPELTGRENIFLNGAILGMSRAEVRRKFDEIVDFAGVEKFLDTPVKRYSSGMYVRLAFAVAAHLEPEILIVDEVLAVGDIEFQKKCLGKMEDVGKGGRTILFVSHNMLAVQQLCTSGILLDSGKSSLICNDISSVVKRYLNEGYTHYNYTEENAHNTDVILKSFEVVDKNGEAVRNIIYERNEPYYAEMCVEVVNYRKSLCLSNFIYSEDSILLYETNSTDGREDQWPISKSGSYRLRVSLPVSLLNNGDYFIEFIAFYPNEFFIYEPGSGPRIRFAVDGQIGDSPVRNQRRGGLLAPVLLWDSVN